MSIFTHELEFSVGGAATAVAEQTAHATSLSQTVAPFSRGIARWVEREFICEVALLPEADGSFSAVSITVPGVFGQGDSREAALADLRSAVAEFIAIVRERGESLPEPGKASTLVATEYLDRMMEARILVRV